MNAIPSLSKRKSVPLTPEQMTRIKTVIKECYGNKTFAAETLDISRVALDRLLLKKSTSQESYNKIVKVIESQPTAA